MASLIVGLASRCIALVDLACGSDIMKFSVCINEVVVLAMMIAWRTICQDISLTLIAKIVLVFLP